MSVEAFTLWRRLDVQGRDACWLERKSDGWLIYGASVFMHQKGPAFVNYNIEYNQAWHTVAAHIQGRAGTDVIEHAIHQSDGTWIFDNVIVHGLEKCHQIDFGFTPATNLAQLKILALDVGQRSEICAAWFDIGEKSLSLLEQSYERKSERSYWYEAPRFNFREILNVGKNGFVLEYPGLWSKETDVEPI